MDRCPSCGKELVRLEVTVGDQELTMKNCSTCDTRRWERNGEVVDLTEVLDLTTEVNRRSTRRSGPRRR